MNERTELDWFDVEFKEILDLRKYVQPFYFHYSQVTNLYVFPLEDDKELRLAIQVNTYSKNDNYKWYATYAVTEDRKLVANTDNSFQFGSAMGLLAELRYSQYWKELNSHVV